MFSRVLSIINIDNNENFEYYITKKASVFNEEIENNYS